MREGILLAWACCWLFASGILSIQAQPEDVIKTPIQRTMSIDSDQDHFQISPHVRRRRMQQGGTRPPAPQGDPGGNQGAGVPRQDSYFNWRDPPMNQDGGGSKTMDCEKFSHLSDPPPECVPTDAVHADSGTGDAMVPEEGGPNDLVPGPPGEFPEAPMPLLPPGDVPEDLVPPAGGVPEDLVPPPPAETIPGDTDFVVPAIPQQPPAFISLQVSMGLMKEPESEERLKEVTSLALTSLLHRWTPFHVRYIRYSYYGTPEDDTVRRFLQEDKPMTNALKELAMSPSSDVVAPSSIATRSLQSNNVDLLLHSTDLEIVNENALLPDGGSSGLWYRATIKYTPAWIRNQRFIVGEYPLGNITEVCEQVIAQVLNSGEFLSRMQETALEVGPDVNVATTFIETIAPDDISTTVDDATDEAPAGDADQPVEETTTDDMGLYGMTEAGEEGNWSTWGTFDAKLEQLWGFREWCGLALCCTTLFVATTLSLSAALLQSRYSTTKEWGTALTEDGVHNLLQVGWRYQQGQQEGGDDENRQLFLQVYDKSKEGYNDNDSMLLGGVEQKNIIPSSTLAATASTPASGEASTGHTDSKSGLPSSTFTGSSPQKSADGRLHKYETSEEGSSTRRKSSKSSKSRRDLSKSRRSSSSSRQAASDKKSSKSSTKHKKRNSTKRKEDDAARSEILSDLTTSTVTAAASKPRSSTRVDLKKTSKTTRSSSKKRPKSSRSQDEGAIVDIRGSGLEKAEDDKKKKKKGTSHSSKSTTTTSKKKKKKKPPSTRSVTTSPR